MNELKHVCKLCNKKYPNGKSLGGHMRSHVIANSKKVANFEGGSSVYVLREKPKKTRRIEDSNLPLKKERFCKQCGRGFASMKALCGHMRRHSDKGRKFRSLNEVEEEEEEENSWCSERKERGLAMESHSDDESKRETRSESATKSRSCSNNSEIEQEEQEELVMCLMMLSRDSSTHFAAESSGNNSVILQHGLSSTYKKKDLKLKSLKHSAANKKMKKCEFEMNNSDSGYFENGAKELESDDSSGGFVGNYGFKDLNVDFRSRLNSSSAQFSNNSIGFKNSVVKKPKQDYLNASNVQKSTKFECLRCNKTFKTHKALRSHIISHKKMLNNHSKKTGISTKSVPRSKNIKGHKCPFCPKVFGSGQALGGHKRSHLTGRGSAERKAKTVAKKPLLDLNLPAPKEEEGSANSRYMSW